MRIDITGQRFGKRVVIEFSHRACNGGSLWRCICDCGEIVILQSSSLRKGRSRSCGSLFCRKNLFGPNFGKRGKDTPNFLDLTGQKFERWTVLALSKRTRIKKNGQIIYYWQCRCQCGIVREVSGISLRRGTSKSCGCYAREKASETCKTRVGVLNSNFGKRGNQVWNFKGYNRNRPRNRDFELWRTLVFKRDDYTCKKCKTKGGTLCAHHIKPWLDFLEARFDKDNGITLCNGCHLLFHKIFGFKGFGPGDIKLFLRIME